MPTVHEDERKLFVGALPQEAKDSDIKEYFEAYGEIDSINLKVLLFLMSFYLLFTNRYLQMDPVTGRSRGFAFIVFKTVEGIEAALQQTAHVVTVRTGQASPELGALIAFLSGEESDLQEGGGSPRQGLRWKAATRRGPE